MAQTTEKQKTRVYGTVQIRHLFFFIFLKHLPHKLLINSIRAFTYCSMLRTCCLLLLSYCYGQTHARLCPLPQPHPALAPPDASHLLGAHQEADHLASAGGGVCMCGVGTGRAGCAVGGQAGQVVIGAVVLGQLAEVLQPPLASQLKRKQRLELQSLYGAQQNHGFYSGGENKGNSCEKQNRNTFTRIYLH